MGDAGQREGKNFCTEWRNYAQTNPSVPCTLSFHTFSNTGQTVFNGDAAKITDAEIENCGNAMIPTSTTCLYDTAVPEARRFLDAINTAYNGLPESEKNTKSIKEAIGSTFMLMTDGMDNESKEHTAYHLKCVFNLLKEAGTTVAFAAANMDAREVGREYGLDQRTCLQMGSDNRTGSSALRAMTEAAIRTTTRARDPEQEEEEIFTQEEREKSCAPTEAAQYTKSKVMFGSGRM
jgi:hypothetical protein